MTTRSMRRIAVVACCAAMVHASVSPVAAGAGQLPAKRKQARIIHSVATKDPVFFITIDDGSVVTPALAQYLDTNKIPVTTFALPEPLHRHKWWYLKRKRMTFENHTNQHMSLTLKSLKAQKKEICEGSRLVRKITGESPRFFRPPFGNRNAFTPRAVKACGMDYIVLWSVEADFGRVNVFGGRGLRRGDIVLLHYIQSLRTSLERVMEVAKASGLRPALLRDYLD